MPLLSHLQGPIDPIRLITSFETVVQDSDVLRTRLAGRDPQSGQWNVELIKADDLPPTDTVELPLAEVEQWARDRGRTPVDMSVCGYDSAIIIHEDASLSWYLNLHHVITDATSSALVFEATAAHYNGTVAPPEPQTATSYYGWARRLSASLESPADTMTRRSVDYWRDRAPAPRIGRLYTAVDSPVPAAERLALPIGPEIMRLANERLGTDYRMLTDDLGWSTLLMTTTALYCHRIAGAERFSIGMPVHNRSKPEARQLIGPTMEVFPVDVEIDPSDTFRSLHKRIGRSILNTLRHAAPGTAPTPDFEAVVNVIPRAEQERFGDTPAVTKWLHSGAIEPSHLLRVQMTGYTAATASHDNGLGGQEFAIDLNDGASTPSHRERATGHFMAVLSEMVTDPDQPIGTQSLCGPDELDRLARWEHGTDIDGQTPLVLDRLRLNLVGNPTVVLARATSAPHSVQSDSTDAVTGDRLWSWIGATAESLVRRGVTPGDRVGVELPRSMESVVAIMAIMAAGASFVPLDPSQPELRRTRLASRAGCVLVLTSVEEISATRGDDGPGLRFSPVARSESDEAYLLFTSGSTGEPKGVPITHGGLANYLRFAEENYVVTGDDGAPQRPIAPLFSALTFDLTLTSLFMPILAGGTLVVVAEDGPAALTTIAATTDINWCKATPSHLELLVRLLPDDHGLATLVVGGEAFGARLAADLLAFEPDLAIYNEYGPTEAVVGCMIHRVETAELGRQSEVPIGVPAPGVHLVVVDDFLQRVPIGSPGELCISHGGVTAGYLGSGDHDLDSPFVTIDGTRFYRSGDLVRLNEDDHLVYLGRKDAQVKVGGIRLDPIEVEESLNTHRLIERSAVRLWSPSETVPKKHCVRCGLPDNIPGVGFDESDVCDTCHAYERVAPITESWFRTPEDLQAKLVEVRTRRTGPYDCLHLLSGGKDSTYALYRLVELGFNPYVLTLDNGFISEGALDNARRSVAELGLEHEIATWGAMNEIFRDSLDRYSNVCHGCYKTIYTLATNRAAEIGAPLIVTGLSRGQLFETRLIPQQFSEDRFDPDAIDRAVLEARKVYHRVDDQTNRLLDTEVFADDQIFEQIEYLDFYRYVDVELAEMFQFLDERAPWVRPPDTGRSTNCLINAAGIHTHQTEQGYHNYAVPYAWDVRLGHKTRSEAIEELDDQLDLGDVGRMLEDVGYRPRPRQVLTAWIEPTEGTDEIPSPAELRGFLADLLPSHAVPSAFVQVETLPLTTNGKLDETALPPPDRVHRPGPTMQVAATTERERAVIDIWERVLQVEPIGPDDDFFVLGGDSLAALEMIVALGDSLSENLAEDLAFSNTTPRTLAAAIDLAVAEQLTVGADSRPDLAAFATGSETAPALSAGELAVLFDQANRPDDVMYNVGRVYQVPDTVDAVAFEAALRSVAKRHQPLSWSYGSPRRPLASEQAVWFHATTDTVTSAELDRMVDDIHRRPFDLDNGPLLRCLVQPVADEGSDDAGAHTAIVFVIHHASGDAGSFATLWRQIDDVLSGNPLPDVLDYAGYCAWQADGLSETHQNYWRNSSGTEPCASLAIHRPDIAEADGFITRASSVSPTALRSEASTGAGTSAAAVALAAVATTVRRYSDGSQVEIGLITTTRVGAAADDLFGYFLNSVPVRIDCAPTRTKADLTTQAAAAIAGALANRAYPLSRIAADRHAEQLPAPNLDVLMAFDELGDINILGSRAEQRVLSNGTAVAPLTFFVEVRDDQIDLSVEHRGSLISDETARAMLDTLDAVLSESVGELNGGDQAPTTPHSVLVGPDLTDSTTVLSHISQHLDAGSNDAAVVCGDHRLTWAELADQANVVAAVLADNQVKPGDLVALCAPRSVELVAAIIGIQLAGAAYVPIDPGYPDDRIALITARAGAMVGIVDEDHRSLVDLPLVLSASGLHDHPWTVPTSTAMTTDGQDASGAERQPDQLDPDSPAYVIFTSGSTGEPRGVPVSHRLLAASTNARADFYPEPPRRFLVPSSPAFDSSIVGLFWTLGAGGTVVLPTEEQAHDIAALHGIATSGISHTLMVPTLYQGLLNMGGATDSWPEHVIVAGEACPPALLQAHFARHPDTALTNEYGPTEATVWATAHHCSPTDTVVPIGPPIAGTWVAVIDSDGHVRPVGVEGDLIIGGAGVVSGYLGDDEATAAKFGSLPTSIHNSAVVGRFFRTGDRAVITDGRLRFLGRGDSQLNIGGTRAEPEDIEDAILAVDGVTAAIAVAADTRTLAELLDALPADAVSDAMQSSAGTADPTAALLRALQSHGEPQLRLVAHVEAPSRLDDPTVRQELRARAIESLPPLLRPARYELHAELPRTPNRKLDRQAAASLPLTDADHGSSAPTGSPGADRATDPELAGMVETLTRLFSATLRTNDFGPDDSFFDHGGHSLLAMELLLAIEEDQRHRLPASALYAAPTPRLLAARIAEQTVEHPGSFLIPIQPNGSKAPIFAIHVLGVDCEFFRPLSARLGGDQPMYGLGQPTTELNTAGPTDVGAVAEIYANEINRVAPDGPISLAAISLGGVVAYELAQQLTAQGRDVSLLALFDALGPAAVTNPPSASLRLNAHLQRAGRDPLRYAAEQLDHQSQRINRTRERANLALRRRLNARTDHQLEIRQFIEDNVNAQASYVYDAYPGKMLVIKAADDPFADYFIDAGMGWEHLAAGGLTINTAPGGHLSMMAEPNVEVVAASLRDALDQHTASDPTASAASESSDNSTIDAATVRRLLTGGLRAGRLPAVVNRLAKHPGVNAEAAALVTDSDRVLQALADATEAAATAVTARLNDNGIDATLVPVPSRLQHATAAIDVAGDPWAASEVMATLDYQPVDASSRAALLATVRAHSWIDYVRRGDTTSRMRLRWNANAVASASRRSAIGKRLAPTKGDFDVVDLPRWAWPAYWPIRPFRLAGDRIRSALQSGGLAQGGGVADLGIFLGTPPGLIEPLLRFAGVDAGQLVVDIGCGDGRVLIEAVETFGCRARGYEIDGDLAAQATDAVERAGVGDRVEIIHGDATTASIDDADVVFAFLPPEAVASILAPTLARLSPSARFLSHEQLDAEVPIPPDRSELVIGLPTDRPETGGITVANLWYGTNDR